MNKHRSGTPAQRRAALVAQCAQQRMAVGAELQELLAPFSPGGWRQYLGAHGKLALTVAGVALGFVAVKPKRVLPLITAGLSVYKLARSALSMLRP